MRQLSPLWHEWAVGRTQKALYNHHEGRTLERDLEVALQNSSQDTLPNWATWISSRDKMNETVSFRLTLAPC